ncbi:transglutaminase-like domain-containing protein [Jongsikchunia kroppenstedtii]|uniref:transglutaminase-like domain-containing protein n=1 Tax=Jongsikchunia kroppenstedtii TaxID=1121721 RepID=UPI00047542A1|nr:transglutaminase-like domain-containing protein [Jongsikchunia kroppenstedtii]
MTTSRATGARPTAALASSRFLDIDHSSVQAFTRDAVGAANSDRDKARRLFAAVRDQIRYDPYTVSDNPEHYQASHVIESGRGYCVPKAVVLTAAFRAAGFPARLGFADVRNHLQTDTLRELMGTDVFVFHGYSHVYIQGRWFKATPAFNSELCARFGVAPIDFTGDENALLHAHSADGSTHMEYVRERGVFNDLPLDDILAGLKHAYGPLIFSGRPAPADVFQE